MGLFGTSLGEASAAAFASPEAMALASIGNPLGGLSNLAAAPATGLFGGASLGSIAGAGGIGFGVGSLAGSFLQRSLGKTGPGPMIGAGVGALGGIAAGAALGSVVPVIGTPIGASCGGIIH